MFKRLAVVEGGSTRVVFERLAVVEGGSTRVVFKRLAVVEGGSTRVVFERRLEPDIALVLIPDGGPLVLAAVHLDGVVVVGELGPFGPLELASLEAHRFARATIDLLERHLNWKGSVAVA